MAGLWVAALVVLAGLAGAFGGAFQNDFRIANSESQEAFELLQERFPDFGGDPLTVPFRADAGINDPGVRQQMEAFFAGVAGLDGVEGVESPYAAPVPVSVDGRIAVARVQLRDFGPAVDPALVREIIERAEATSATGLQVDVGGPTAMFAELEPPGESEAAGVLVALVILLVTFGSVMAAGLPILVALAGLGAGMTLVLLSTRVLEVFTFAPAMAAMIGLGVGIDYALFIVTRYRQGLHAGQSPADAAATAVDTSGRAVVFAGATVIISLLGMVLMGVSMIVGMAIATSLVVLCTVVAAVTLLPAVLGFIGPNIDRLAIQRLRHADHDARTTVWYRWSRQIQAHPWIALLASLAVLIGLALPVFSMELGGPHFGAGPESQSSRRAYDLVTEGFGEGFNGPLVLVAEVDPAAPQQLESLAGLVEQVRADPGVALVAPAVPNAAGDTAVVLVVPTSAPHTVDTQQLVHRLRDDIIPSATAGAGVTVKVSGVTALFADMAELFNARLPVFILAVIVLSFLLLMVVFRSVLVPLKAAVMNLLSIGAAYGIVVAVFQWGWGADIIGVARPGPIMAFVPVMLFAILFGLSMDYEVFLLSRVREEYDRSGDNALAVADGLAATARVITAAAAIMVIIFLSFVLGDDPIVKAFGLGLAAAVFVDATIVRMILVPATMELLGDANWWLPGWLDRALPRLRLESEQTSDTVPAPATVHVTGAVAAWLARLPTEQRGRALAQLEHELAAHEASDGQLTITAGRSTRRLLVTSDTNGDRVLSSLRPRGNDRRLPWLGLLHELLSDPDVAAAYHRSVAGIELGGSLRDVRHQRGLTVGEVARAAGVVSSQVELLEAGDGDLETLTAVSMVLGARVRVVTSPHGGDALPTVVAAPVAPPGATANGAVVNGSARRPTEEGAQR